MKIDLHCHSKYSYDSYLEPYELIEQAVKRDMDGVCFTEHHSIVASWPVEKVETPEGFYIFRGLEVSTDRGHLLVYGVKDDSWNIWSRNNYLVCIEVIERVHALGGICVPAHPYRGFDSLGDDVMRIDGFDAIETHNSRNPKKSNQKAARIAQLKSLPSIGGSDCHNREEVGRAFTAFKNPVYTIDKLIEEIRKGNCTGMSF